MDGQSANPSNTYTNSDYPQYQNLNPNLNQNLNQNSNPYQNQNNYNNNNNVNYNENMIRQDFNDLGMRKTFIRGKTWEEKKSLVQGMSAFGHLPGLIFNYVLFNSILFN